MPFHRAQIFLPLLFNMDQRPLPSAEGKMLEPRDGEKVFFMIHC